MNLEMALLMLPGLVIGLTLHEFGHAWSASLLGDGFARRQGRVSLNPLRHLSPLGTLALLVLPFGWGRPVPVNLYNFKRPRRDYFLVSLAGPAANLIVLGVCIGLMQWTRHSFWFDDWRATTMVFGHHLLWMTAVLNVLLATINLLPIPPLDGSKIWPVLASSIKPAGRRRTQWLGLFLLLGLLWSGKLDPIIESTLQYATELLPRSDAHVYYEHAEEAGRLAESEQWRQAEVAYSTALAVNPRSHECLFGRAVARDQLGRRAEALQDVTAAIQLSPASQYYEGWRSELVGIIDALEAAGLGPDGEPLPRNREGDGGE